MTKEFGVAHTYEAARIHGAAVVIVAVGEAPYLNTRVTLEQLPWRIYPPHFGLFFETPPFGLPATRPFVVSAVVGYPADIDELTIIDANGRHLVKIVSVIQFRAAKVDVNAEKEFLAYKQIGFANCMIAPVDAVVPMIFRRAFGPASYADCEAWIAQNCGKAA
jgi:hypothetical protein